VKTLTKKISIIGSTGSIGRQTLDIAKTFPDRIEVVGLAAGSNLDLLVEQIKEFKPRVVSIMDSRLVDKLSGILTELNLLNKIEVYSGGEGLIKVATMDEIDTVVTSVTGTVGLLPTVEAIKKGKNIALANKETLVAAGELVMELVREKGVKLLPVDSEHSAIFQCLAGEERRGVNKIILTASGGPFRGKDKEFLEKVTIDMALKHPNWAMGKKITIDSATLMNKGLEVIEAKWLFDIDFDSIDVVVHPQSIIHSMVEYQDGAILAHLGVPDMRIPIQYALLYPERLDNQIPKLNLVEAGKLTFEAPNVEDFPSLKLAYDAGRIGGTMPAAMNAANERLVELYLQEAIGFLDIPKYIALVMEKHQVISKPSLEAIIEADGWARQEVDKLIYSK
jgi:1-deoxy-D-xylulose-5-phosphate reductoisomerase